MEEVSLFIKKVNLLIDVIEDGSYLNKADTTTDYDKVRFPELNPILELVYRYATKDYPFDFFLLEDEIKENNQFLLFGKNLTHDLSYAYEKKTGKILALDEDGDKAFYCAPDATKFLKVINKLIDIEIKINSEEGINDNEIQRSKKAALDFLGGKEYQEFIDLALVL